MLRAGLPTPRKPQRYEFMAFGGGYVDAGALPRCARLPAACLSRGGAVLSMFQAAFQPIHDQAKSWAARCFKNCLNHRNS